MNRDGTNLVRNRRTATWRLKLLLGVGGCLFALCAIELAGRVTGRFEPPPYPPRCARPELYEAHDPYGYRLHVSQTMQYSYPRRNPRQLTIVSNRFGFRDSRDPQLPHDGPRVVVLGDSFVFGEGVEQSERFTDLVQSRRPDWRVDNLGLPGFGLDTMLRALEAVGLRARPNVIVVCIYTDDFRRVRPHFAGVGFKIPRFRLKAGQLESVPYPRRRIWDGLHVVELFRGVAWKLSGAEADLNTAILDRILELADEIRARPVLVFLPAQHDMPADQARRQWLRDFAQQRQVAYLDLTDPIARFGQSAFIAENPHYNPTGHRIVAEALEGVIEQQLHPSVSRLAD
jgi:hypothetical protein